MAIFTVFFQMLALLIMIGTGYFVTKKGMMDEHTNTQMSKMIVNVFNPLLVFASAANSVGMISLDTMGIVGLIAVGMFLIFIIAGMLLAPFFDKDRGQQKIFQLMFVFSNLGFIGIPVVTSISLYASCLIQWRPGICSAYFGIVLQNIQTPCGTESAPVYGRRKGHGIPFCFGRMRTFAFRMDEGGNADILGGNYRQAGKYLRCISEGI